ncbi:hypothetical protein ACFLTU_06310, partial [Bacteroidota bacterium]
DALNTTLAGIEHSYLPAPNVNSGAQTWNVISKPDVSSTVTFSDQTSPTSTISVNHYGTYELQWKEINGNCSVTENITIKFYEKPDGASAGIAPTPACDALNTTLAGIEHSYLPAPNVNSGAQTWDVINKPDVSSTVTFSDQTSPTSTISVNHYGTYELQWKEINGNCSATENISITFYEQPTVTAPMDQEICASKGTTLTATSHIYTGSPNQNWAEYQWDYESGQDATPTFSPSNALSTTVLVDNYGDYVFSITETNGICSDKKNVNVKFIDGPPIDLMLVLDLSGSMLSHIPSTAPLSKLEILENAVEVFLIQWQQWNDWDPLIDHRIGSTYFKTTITNYPIGLSGLQTTTSNLHTNLININTVNTDLTAMGGGLKFAIMKLDNIAHTKKILLFTDGMQNVNPMVNENPPHKIEDGAGSSTIELDNIDERIYSIGVGINDERYRKLLKDISWDDENSYFTLDASTDLGNFFDNHFQSIMDCHSPKLIDYRHGNITGGIASEGFTVSRNAGKLLLKVVTKTSSKFEIKIKKDTVEIPLSAGDLIQGSFYKLFFVDLPLQIGSQTINPEGTWEIIITGNDGLSYQAAAIEDDHGLNFNCKIISEDNQVGKPIEFEVDLSSGGRPIKEGCQISAIILKPGEDLGTLLAKTKIPSDNFKWTENGNNPQFNISPVEGNSFESGYTTGHQKFQVLMSDPDFFTSFTKIKSIVQLTNNGDGSYTGKYTETEKSGTYTVMFQVDGEPAGVGEIFRTDSRTVIVKYGEIIAKESNLYVLPEKGGDISATLSIRPRDHKGNLIGPDYSDNINVNLSEGSSGKIFDHLDGRYKSSLIFPDNADPEITISVFDQEIYKGEISKLKEKFSIGLSGLYSLPVSNFSNSYSAGPGLSIDFDWMLKSWMSLDFQAEYRTFNTGYNIAGGAAYINFIPPIYFLGFTPYFSAGAGFYKPKNIDLSSGLTGKLGFKRRLSGNKSVNKSLGFDLNHLWIDIHTSYHYMNVPNNDRDFVGLCIGLRYSF